jgi:anti-sigma28 factor (negative regulator of flagellin synthesis)
MDVQGPTGVGGIGRVPGVGPTGPPRPPMEPGAAPAEDQVQISTVAHLKSLLAQLPDVRQDLVDRVRAEIASGAYDRDDKALDIALDRLFDDLTGKSL